MTQLNPMLPVYVVPFEKEGYCFAIESYSLENYLMFHIIMDGSGEIWSFPQTEVRGTINYSALRKTINKDKKSVHIDKLKG